MSELKKKIFELTHCAGCQTCLRIDEKDEITQLEHFIASDDITEEVQRLRSALKSPQDVGQDLNTNDNKEVLK